MAQITASPSPLEVAGSSSSSGARRTLIVGSRKSELALWQTREVVRLLTAQHPEL